MSRVESVREVMARRVQVTGTLPIVEKRKARKSRGGPSAGGARGGGRSTAAPPFDPTELNKQYALVSIGAGAMIVRERADGPIDDRIRLLSPAAFKLKLANQFVGRKTAAEAWLASPGRRDYDGVEFYPDPENAAGTPGYLNLWHGFSVEPMRKPNGYSVLADHMFTNVCGGDQELYRWLFGWFAHMVQRPRERPGTAVVLRGPQGVGKTKIGEAFGSLLTSHYALVSDPRYVVGQFNAHMAKCLLLQADEAVWAGDKKAEGRLKSLVTEKHQMIEQKGVDSIQMPNYVRLLMTSNEGWVVPAGKDERRFCVLDVGTAAAQNYEYFAELDDELEAGGREALLYDLLNFDLSTVNVRSIPRTGALLEQKVRSLDSVENWWLERLIAGMVTHKHDRWDMTIASDALFDDYVSAAEKIGVRRKSEQTVFAMKLRRLVPRLERKRLTIPDSDNVTVRRTWCYVLPPLEACRAAFEEAVGQQIEWEEPHESTA